MALKMQSHFAVELLSSLDNFYKCPMQYRRSIWTISCFLLWAVHANMRAHAFFKIQILIIFPYLPLVSNLIRSLLPQRFKCAKLISEPPSLSWLETANGRLGQKLKNSATKKITLLCNNIMKKDSILLQRWARAF